MPTTRLKNTLYRLALPFAAPKCPTHPFSSVSGRQLACLRELEILFRRHHVLGAALLLTSGENNAILCSSAENPKHISRPEMYFRVASITKTATAILTLSLVEQGLLDLDAPVSDCFTDASAREVLKGITLRQLLSHRSGIVDPPGLASALEDNAAFPSLLSPARRHSPGEAFVYSNFGFGLVGCVLESILNEPLGRIFEHRLFTPLGMNATLEGCLLPSRDIMPVVRVLPYRPDAAVTVTTLGSRPLLSPDPLRHFGHTAGSLYTDIESLQKMLDVLIRPDIGFLSPSSVEQMKRKHASYGELSPSLSYGLGLLRIEDPSLSDGVIYGHQGFAYGCVDGAFWEASTRRSVILLNGGASEARTGRLGLLNRDIIAWAFRKEMISW